MFESTFQAKYWLGFNLVPGLGPIRVRQLIAHFGDLRTAWHASPAALTHLGLEQRALSNLLQAREQIDLDARLAQVQQAGVQLLTWDDPAYPPALLHIHDPPPLLFCHGALSQADARAVAIVGTRRLTRYGRRLTEELVTGLVHRGFTIISGLARGIDAVAHRTAVAQGGRTVAVLGSGLDHIYPPEHRQLARSIVAEGQGAILSEYALGVKPEARNFPPRNRIISGLSLAVVVVEAGSKSGALITARFALEQDREVMAVPGNVNSPASRGPNQLIQQGAKLVRHVDDVLEELHVAGPSPAGSAQQTALPLVPPPPKDPVQVALLDQLRAGPAHVDELTRATGLPAAEVGSALALMELDGLVEPLGGLRYASRFQATEK